MGRPLFVLLLLMASSLSYAAESVKIRLGNSDIVFYNEYGNSLTPVPELAFNTDYSEFVSYEGISQLSIDGTPIENGGKFIFSDIRANKGFVLKFMIDGKEKESTLIFTSVPVIRIDCNVGYNYSSGTIDVQELGKEMLHSPIEAKWRGGSTNDKNKHKRNYHIKFKDDGGNSKDVSLFGLRKDNSWLLDAGQVDMLRIRNRIVTELWNDYSAKPYYATEKPDARTGVRGNFVEVIVNDQYVGLYSMTENMDRKQLKLRKYDEELKQAHGVLYKTKSWNYNVFMGHDSNSDVYPMTSPVYYDEFSATWGGMN